MDFNIAEFAQDLQATIWGTWLQVFLLGTGIYLTIGLKLMPVRRLKAGFESLINPESSKHNEQNDGLTPLQALMTALSGTIGAGNIIGVASAILLGGPGAIFWMWMTTLCGMATKYAEAVMAVKYRTRDSSGLLVGGPMYYIKYGLGKKWLWLGGVYALAMALAGLITGHMIQSNAMATVLNENFGIENIYTAIVITILVSFVIVGGVKSIGRIAEFIVPIMTGLYLVIGVVILMLNFSLIPEAFKLIFDGAFNGTAAVGGFAGAAIAAAIQQGVARGLYSNEAGLGSAAIAHGSCETNDPIKQGEIAMLGTVIDTIIICTMTALIILTVQIEMGGVTQSAWLFGDDGNQGAVLTSKAFSAAFPGGGYVVIIGQVVFSFTTIIAWSLYVERAGVFLTSEKMGVIFRTLSIIAVFAGCMWDFGTVWAFGLSAMGLMAVPNLIALLLKSREIFAMTDEAHSERLKLKKHI